MRTPFWPPKEAREPDVLVGIDIGTSFTKVAYTIRQDEEYGDIRKIQGGSTFGYENHETDRIATMLAYRKGAKLHEEGPKYFGKKASEQRQDVELDIYEWFKEEFPDDLASRKGSGSSNANANRRTKLFPPTSASTDTTILYKEFLQLLYVAIKTEISAEMENAKGLPLWRDAHVEFIFSVPATWNRIHETLGNITARFEEVIKLAGFGGKDQTNHHVSIGLTEPEAAAMYYLAKNPSEFPQEGQTILVVDSGGGTTDLCLVHIRNTQLGELSIDRMNAPVGENVGSTHIDRMFEELARKRLGELSHQLKAGEDWNIPVLSHRITHGSYFEICKQSLDFEKAAGSGIFTLDGPDLRKYQDLEDGPLVHNYMMKFTYHELAELFDKIIDDSYMDDRKTERLPGINTLIHRVRDQTRNAQRSSSKGIDMILLAGGLGRSPYLRHRVEQALEESNKPGTKTPQVVIVDQPQHCVSQGLLHDRLWKIFGHQKCIANYGIIRKTKARLLSLRHIVAKMSNQTTPIGNKTFVNDIKWLVKKGDPIPLTPLKYSYTFEPGEKEVVLIVVSGDEKAQKFYNAKHDDIAEVSCDFGQLSQDLILTNKSCEVELTFSVGKFDVNCWYGEDRILVGKYRGKFGKNFPGFSFTSEGSS